MKNRRMVERISFIICGAVLIAGIFFFIGYKTGYDRLKNMAAAVQAQTFYATVSDISDHTVTVKGMEVNDINFRGDFVLTVTEETKIVWRYTDIAFEDLDVGDHIAVTFSGEIMESYPAQIAQTEQIQLLDDEI